jgi:hypothetical protein
VPICGVLAAEVKGDFLGSMPGCGREIVPGAKARRGCSEASEGRWPGGNGEGISLIGGRLCI